MKKAYDIFIWCVTGLFIGAIFLLPESVPVHWNGNWEIDRYGSRYTLIILAIIPILLYYGMLLAKKVDPKRHNFQSREITYDLFRYGLSFFFILLCCFFYYMTFFPKANGEKIMLLLLGILIIGMGNYMPRLPQNYFLGIKTQWTLSNEYVWQKTHKIGGYSFVIVGIIIAVYGLLELPYSFIVVIVGLLIDAVFSFIYSYIVFKRIETEKD